MRCGRYRGPMSKNRRKLRWEFYRDKRNQWRWRATAPNGKRVGASTESYRNLQDCKENAALFGWSPRRPTEQRRRALMPRPPARREADWRDGVFVAVVLMTLLVLHRLTLL